MKYVLIGANNPHSVRLFLEFQEINKFAELYGFIDNDPQKIGEMFWGYPILGGTEVAGRLDTSCRYINLITRDCLTRFQTSREVYLHGGKFANLIHPSVTTNMVSIGTGNYIQERVVLQAGVLLNNNCSIHMGSLIGHETNINHGTFIAHGVSVSGCVSIGQGVFIGAGAVLHPRITIGDFATIGAGAVIRKDVKPGEVLAGNPSKVFKTKKSIPQSFNPFTN